jgi:hypothetical protein
MRLPSRTELNPKQAQLVSEKYFFASPASKHPYKEKVTNATTGTSTYKSQAQADIKVPRP